jgi:hypothetical protein
MWERICRIYLVRFEEGKTLVNDPTDEGTKNERWEQSSRGVKAI